MSKKLPKENLKKVSGAAGFRGNVAGDVLKGKNVSGGKQVLPGQANKNDTITNLKGNASNLRGNVLERE